MAYKTYHMSICVRGVLEWKDKKMMKSLFPEFKTVEEVRNHLYDKLKEGYETLPVGGIECKGFDKIDGCKGHAITKKQYEQKLNKHKI